MATPLVCLPRVALFTDLKQSQEIERLQKRALGDVSYDETCSTLGLLTLNDRREKLTKHFFNSSHNRTVVLIICYHQNVIFQIICVCADVVHTNFRKQVQNKSDKLNLFYRFVWLILPNHFFVFTYFIYCTLI